MTRTNTVLSGIGLLLAVLLTSSCGPKYPNCDNDEDCHEGEFCVNGQCQMCRTDGDCPTGQRCAGGRCEEIPGFCQADGDCGPGEECRDGACVAAAQAAQDLPESERHDDSCSLQPVFFGFDSTDLGSDARNALTSNARCLKGKGVGAHLTGHADPRGTEEYNLALGDRRARAVRGYLKSLGVDESKVSVSSVGEEMASGHDESSYALDRKVVFSEQ